MFKQAFAYIQYVLPQHLLTNVVGWLANSRTPWVKNFLIKQFIKLYHINMNEAEIENPEAYPDFNSFFIRKLKPNIRPLATDPKAIASPADGTVAMMGQIHKNQLVQAKGMYFDIEKLLGGDVTLCEPYYDGTFATIYLAPNNYHRVHMPFNGKLRQTIYVPGKLFSVNQITSDLIPNLYSRNERLVCIFDTSVGPMVVIMVGAMIVGSIQMTWMEKPIRADRIVTETFSTTSEIKKGEELGYFKMGSTVIVLLPKGSAEWDAAISSNQTVKVGQFLGNIIK